jgi:site-specific recombinase XerD
MKRMHPLTQNELVAVLAAAKAESQRDHALLLTCYSHAMRANECGKLLVADVNLKDWTIRVKRSKGSLDTTEKLMAHSNRLLDEKKTIEAWLKSKAESPFLFPSRKTAGFLGRERASRIYRHYAEVAGLPATKHGIHALKHTLGQNLADRGTDVATMRVILGHKLITSTQRYFDVTQAAADSAKRAVLVSI